MPCKDARSEDGKDRCTNSSMVLHVGMYCDPVLCSKVKSGEVKAI